MTEKHLVEVDHLAVGLTRSPMFMGINIRLFFANIAVCTLICIDAHTVLGIPIFLILHLVTAKLSIAEPDFFSIWIKSFFKTTPVLNFNFWGKTNSYEPW
ncbi:MAG: VirB3 family type IV secretion system protein [Gammaproteobacteria bacterium]|nr:VirB3 family type IV secretion system protein [Gammaproteobacteria bacterium]